MSPLDDAFLDAALAVARRAADAAAAAIAAVRAAGIETRIKSDLTPVTQADLAAEAAVRAVLSEAYPDHAIYGEEQGHDARDSDFLWLVDPIDGTKSFVRGYPMYSTQIALMHRGALVLGVSAAPHFCETAWARRGGGAWLNGQPIRVVDRGGVAQAALSFGNLKSLAASPGWTTVAGLLQQADRGRGYGDFWHYHLLARGAIDAVVESDVNILDIAALAVIVREAGGVFTDLDGGGLDLDTRTVLAATPALHAELQARFAGWRG